MPLLYALSPLLPPLPSPPPLSLFLPPSSFLPFLAYVESDSGMTLGENRNRLKESCTMCVSGVMGKNIHQHTIQFKSHFHIIAMTMWLLCACICVIFTLQMYNIYGVLRVEYM